jgi:hypothetical protein
MDGPETPTSEARASSNDAAVSAEEIGFALLLSVPVGAGVSTAMLRVTGAGLLTPIVAGPGLVTALVLFGFLLVALLRGE